MNDYQFKVARLEGRPCLAPSPGYRETFIVLDGHLRIDFRDGAVDLKSKSPNYHHWLSAKEVGERYGLATHDLDVIEDWLKSHGFRIDKATPTVW